MPSQSNEKDGRRRYSKEELFAIAQVMDSYSIKKAGVRSTTNVLNDQSPISNSLPGASGTV